MSCDLSSSATRPKERSRRGLLTLALFAVAFLALRGPVMYRQPGGQDEDCYAVPGLTILQSGVPRLPHVPARNVESVYYRADDALFAEPPLYFYYQSLFYAVLPHVYGTARLASAVAGVLTVVLVYRVSLEAGGNEVAALWGAGLLTASRWLLFPATCARPDMLCAVFGFASVLCVVWWQMSQRPAWLVLCGVGLGLGGLTHFYAIIYAVPLAMWVGWTSRGWRRLGQPAVMAGVSVLIVCLWLPLIFAFPEAARMQFDNQFGSEKESSLMFRALLPWAALRYHAGILWQHVGAWQFLLVSGSLLYATVDSWRQRKAVMRGVCWLAWSSVYLLCVTIGTHHAVIGYWVFPAGLMFVCVGAAIQRAFEEAAQRSLVAKAFTSVAVGAAALLMLPGSGLRTLVTYVRNWNDINYDSPRFARQLLESLPAGAVYGVDTQIAMDFVAAGRPTLLAQINPLYFRMEQFDYDYLVVSRYGTDTGIAGKLDVRHIRTVGLRDDPFACYAEVYERRSKH